MQKKKEKVLLAVTKSVMGGASRAVYELAGALKETHVVVVAAGAPAEGAGKGELLEKLHNAQIPTVAIPSLARDIHLIKELKTFSFFLSRASFFLL